MRIHRLRLQAFGPFAEEVEVDLDALSDAGLFLLTGATGAGKTSILDAVCFGLYGAVPGDRQIAKRLRSDHAGAAVAPEVTLELTLAGRRVRIDRSPAWERPKKRGTGTTTAQATVLVQERVDGAWIARATRLDEAGHLLGGLLGMTQNQFTQVQMLPQGRFQTFLRSGSDDRQRLLHQLFRTSRFEAVEAWLRDHRRALGRESADHQDHVAALLNRVSEAAGCDLPPSWTPTALADMADEVGPWAEEVRASTVAVLERALRTLGPAEVEEQASRAAVDAARSLADQQARHQRAGREREALQAAAAGHDRDVERLAAGRRAVPVLVHVDAAHRSAGERDRAAAVAARDLDHLASLLDAPDLRSHAVASVADQCAADLATARAALPRLDELDTIRAAVSTGRQQLEQLTEELATLDAELVTLPGTVADHAAAEHDARRAADGVEAAEREVALGRQRLVAALEVVGLLQERDTATGLHREAVDTVQALKEEWLSLQERRLSGMAAEIALGLAAGHDCPVCGSADHPHPARPLPGSPGADAVREARRQVDDAEVVRHARELAIADLDARVASARERSGQHDVPGLERHVADLETSAAELRASAAELAGLTALRRDAEQRLAEVRRRVHQLHGERSSTASALSEREQRLDALQTEVDGILEGSGHGSGHRDLRSLVDELGLRADAAGQAHRSHLDALRTVRAADDAEVRATEAATAQGFGDADEAVAAATEAGDLDVLAARVDAHRQRLAAVEATLADPALRAAASSDEPDLDGLLAQHRAAEARLRAARDDLAAARRRVARLDGLVNDLHDRLTAWSPVRARHALADRMATLADGSSTDNRLRMRLSGYVLAARLAQVVAAGNERLAVMLDGRYLLEHSDDRGAGETRGGLSLRVRDEWSGESRDPVTLSGGETFVVSLALALGLSDVISHEAGGTELDTLFVDEGFGSLDADSLDHVMDMLDSLRDGGRVVGVVSHVPELRDRIPAQLHVEKRRTGSRVSQTGQLSAMR